jgi:hypothetical protein
MGLFLRFRYRLPPSGSRIRATVDLDGGLIGGHADVLMLNHDALFASGSVALQRFEMGGECPQQFHRHIARLVEPSAIVGLAQQIHGKPVDSDHLGCQHRLGFVLRRDTRHRGQGGVQVLFLGRLIR